MITLAAASLVALDWIVIGGFIGIAVALGVWFTRRASRSTEDFFLSGRTLPWWIAGTSIVATTFAADTPLAISGIVRGTGLSGNWFWWCIAFNGMLGATLLARLWRRSSVVTDVGFVRLRYDGRSMHILQVFRVFFFGVLYNAVTLAWVFFAMGTILRVCLGPEVQQLDLMLADWAAAGGPALDSKMVIIAALMLVSAAYAISGGFWGVVATDMLQFVVALGGSIALAAFAVDRAGGMENILKVASTVQPQANQIIPPIDAPGMAFVAFVLYASGVW